MGSQARPLKGGKIPEGTGKKKWYFNSGSSFNLGKEGGGDVT